MKMSFATHFFETATFMIFRRKSLFQFFDSNLNVLGIKNSNT